MISVHTSNTHHLPQFSIITVRFKGILKSTFFPNSHIYGRCIAIKSTFISEQRSVCTFTLSQELVCLIMLYCAIPRKFVSQLTSLKRFFYVLSDKCLMDSFCLSVIFLVGFSNYINWSSCDERCYQQIFETFVPLLCHKSIKSAYLLLFSLYIQLSTRLVISLVPNKNFPLLPLLLEQCTTYPPRMFLHFGLSWLFSFSFLFCHQESLIWNLFLSLLHYSFIWSIRQWRHCTSICENEKRL